MGTNFYRKRILTEEEKENLIKAIQDNRIISFSYSKEGSDPWDTIDSEELDVPLSVHIAKRSCGWRFLFDHNKWKYFHDTKSLKEFLTSEGAWIEDEYGRTITPEEFWNDFEEFNDGKPHNDSRYYIQKDMLDYSDDFC